MWNKPAIGISALGLLLLFLGFVLNNGQVKREQVPEGTVFAVSALESTAPRVTPPTSDTSPQHLNGQDPGDPNRRLWSRSGSGREGLKRPVEALHPDPVERIVNTALFDPDPDERKYAIGELTVMDEWHRLWRVCLKALEDQDPDVRIEAVLALENFGTSSLKLLQTVARSDASMDVRVAALDTIESVERSRSPVHREQ